MDENRSYTIKELREISELIQKHDPSPANALGTNVPHGLEAAGHPFAGLWTTPGPRPDMWAMFARPRSIAQLLVSGAVSREQRSEFEILTGITAGSGSNPVNFCDPAPKAGLAKSCIHRAYFGALRLDTNTTELPTLGGYLNAADYDRSIINLEATNNPFVPDILANATNPNSQTFMELFTAGIQFERISEQLIFQGNNTVALGASTFTGVMREFNGFDNEITTGRVDAIANVACPAADSLVQSWGSALITGSVAGPGGVFYNIVEVLTEMWHYLKTKAEQQNMLPTTWVMSMRYDLFRALTRAWSCIYVTNGCNVASGSQPNNIDAVSQKQMQDEMFNGRFLWMDGERVPVVCSDGIANTAINGGFRSDIYFIPLNSLGVRTTFIEFFDQANNVITDYNNVAGPSNYRTLNNGAMALARMDNGFCLQYRLAMQPRLIMRTPQLAARLTNIVHRNFIYSDDPFPGGVYHRDGGQTQRYSPTLF